MQYTVIITLILFPFNIYRNKYDRLEYMYFEPLNANPSYRKHFPLLHLYTCITTIQSARFKSQHKILYLSVHNCLQQRGNIQGLKTSKTCIIFQEIRSQGHQHRDFLCYEISQKMELFSRKHFEFLLRSEILLKGACHQLFISLT